MPVSVDSKPLTQTLSPLDATLTKNMGVESLWLTKHPNEDAYPGRARRVEESLCKWWEGFSYFLTSLPLPLMIASATSPAHPSDAPSARPSAATRSGWPSARNTISPAGPHRQSASTADYASIPPPAGSSSPDPAAEKLCRTSGKSKPAERTNSTPPRNRSGKDPV